MNSATNAHTQIEKVPPLFAVVNQACYDNNIMLIHIKSGT